MKDSIKSDDDKIFKDESTNLIEETKISSHSNEKFKNED